MAVPATPELPDPTGDDVIEQARRQVVAGHYLQAVAGLTAHLDAHPDDALAWRRLAGALIGAGFLPRAIAAADRAIELAPDEPIAYRNRSVANMTLKNFAAMRADAERALALASDDPEVLTLLAYGALLVDRDVPQARAYWERAYALDPQHAAVRRVGLILRSEPRYALLLAAAPGAYAGIVTLGFAAATLELPWLLAPVAVFAVILVAAILVRFRRVPPRPAGPGVLHRAQREPGAEGHHRDRRDEPDRHRRRPQRRRGRLSGHGPRLHRPVGPKRPGMSPGPRPTACRWTSGTVTPRRTGRCGPGPGSRTTTRSVTC